MKIECGFKCDDSRKVTKRERRPSAGHITAAETPLTLSLLLRVQTKSFVIDCPQTKVNAVLNAWARNKQIQFICMDVHPKALVEIN